MGHHTAEHTFTAEEANRIGSASHGLRLAGALVAEAVALWYADEAERWADARNGGGVMAPIQSAAMVERYANEHQQTVMNDSLVVPVAAETDVTVTRKRVRVTVGQAALVRLRQSHQAGHKVTGWSEDFATLTAGVEPGRVAEVRVLSVPKAAKPVATATAGKLTAEYLVMETEYGQSRALAVCSSLAAARAEALRIMAEDARITGLSVTSRQVRLAEDGSTSRVLLSLDRGDKPATVEVELVLHDVKPGAKPAWYHVAFDYHI